MRSSYLISPWRPTGRRPRGTLPARTLPGRVAAAVALAAATLAAASLAGCSGDNGPDQTVDAFLEGWRTGKLDQVGFVDPSGQKIAAKDVVTQLKQLSGDLSGTLPGLRRDGKATISNGIANATAGVDWTLPGGLHWTYSTGIRLKQGADDAWQVIWDPAVVQKGLTSGDALSVRRLPAQRGAVLDGAGQPIVTARPVVRVGLAPREITDLPGLIKQLDAAFKAIRPAITPPIDLADLPERVKRADPDSRVEVVTLRKEAYDQIRSRIQPLPGTQFLTGQLDLAPTREFARALLGSVDEAQKQDVDANPGAVGAGDMVGHGGLQGAFDKQLRGTAGAVVEISRKDPEGKVTSAGEVFRREPQPGAPVKTRLDVGVQNAADAALALDPKHRTALVAMRISDGSLVAVANGPGAAAENLAFTAQVPPGSTFKMVSTLGLLDQGAVSLDTPVDCPKTFTVDGRSFKNSENFELGIVPFRTDFAKSCNTAFAALAPKLGPDGLAAAGRTVGLEGSWNVGLDAFTGTVSTGGSAAERAAASFGQGTTLVSPLAMAAATAAVARGQWQRPTLVDSAPAAPPGPQLKPGSLEPLRTMMREVVTTGTAAQLAKVPGPPVQGKTGTAEYDNNPANTHAWFVGWRGDLAFAVFVEQGGSSATSAVPITDRFLRGLPTR